MPKKSSYKQTQRLNRRAAKTDSPTGKKTLPGPEEPAAKDSGNLPDQKQEIEEAIERSRRFYNESFATRMLREINSRRETPLMGCDVTDEERKSILGDTAGDPQASQPVVVGTITLRLRPGKPKAQALLRAIKSRPDQIAERR